MAESLRQERLEKLDEVLQAQGIDIADIEDKGVHRLNFWQGMIKNADDQAEIVNLAGIELRPSFFGVELPEFVPDPVKITPTRARGKSVKGLTHAIVIPDLQAGRQRHTDGYEDDYQDMHDDEALETGLSIIKDHQPERILMNGDNIDFPSLSTFGREKRFEGVLQANINRVHEIMARVRAVAPNAQIDWLEGNHEYRLARELGKLMFELLGVKRPGAEHPIVSVPNLLGLDQLDINYHPGYPANAVWLNPLFKVEHGRTVASGASTAARIAMRSNVSVCFGHVHRRELHTRRFEAEQGKPRTITAVSFGTLANLNGQVPSTHSAVDDNGRPLEVFENWQHGIGSIYYDQERSFIAPIAIDDGQAVFQGVRYGGGHDTDR